ncbi:MAG: DUF2306 domain-containing protein [Chloroflexi bacterium]|nr:DUF2306 domain-containing protein [Chloroflexota bacterium]
MRNKLLWGLMTLLCLCILLIVSRYLTLDPAVFFPEQRAVYLAHLTALIIHVIGSMLALALGPFLFLNGLRIKWPAVHRWLGRLYLLGNLLGGVAGIYMATYAYTGGTTSVAFALLGILWLATGLMAFVRIRAGNVHEHRRWMVRNFALTLAGVMLRLQTLFLAMAFGFEVGYMIVAWSCWVPNLLVAEWFLRQQRSPVAHTLVKTMRLNEV